MRKDYILSVEVSVYHFLACLAEIILLNLPHKILQLINPILETLSVPA